MSARSLDSSERVVVLGLIGGAFGVAGWVKIESFTDPPSNLLKYPVWWVRANARSEWVDKRPLETRMAGSTVQAHFEGVDTREQAASLRGAEIGVKRGDLPVLPPGEYYWDDLIGLEASSPEGERLGIIAEIRAAPAHALLRVVDDSGSIGKRQEIWIPLVRDRIKSIDLAAQCVVLDWQRDW